MKQHPWTNWALVISGIIMATSGLVLQIHYHLMKSPVDATLWRLTRLDWNTVHVWSSVGFTVAIIRHLWTHRKWYKTVVTRRLFSKNRSTIILTILTIIVVATGIVPWLMGVWDGDVSTRLTLVEIHDKIAILLLILIIAHITRKVRKNCKKSHLLSDKKSFVTSRHSN